MIRPNLSPIVFDVKFSESVNGFDENDVDVSGITGTAGINISGSGDTYTVSITGMDHGENVVASIKENAAQDAAGNESQTSTSNDNSVTYDLSSPAVSIEQGSSQGDPTQSSPIVFDVFFNENVSDFDENDVDVSGMAGTAGINVSGSGDTTRFPSQAWPTVRLWLPASKKMQPRTRPGTKAWPRTAPTTRSHTTLPALPSRSSRETAQDDPTQTSPIIFDVLFSEDVTGFDENDVDVSGIAGTAGINVTGSGDTYTVSITGMADGETVIASVKANAAKDAAGNDTFASTSKDNSVTYDTSGGLRSHLSRDLHNMIRPNLSPNRVRGGLQRKYN